MNKLKKLGIAFILALGVSQQATAAFVLTGTRFIYHENDKNISVLVDNEADQAFGGQVWIDNTNQPQDEVFMIPTPSIFRVEAGEQQVIRLMNVSSELPSNQESLFWLNVMEVPPMSESDGPQLAFAMNTKVKLIYRPTNLKKGRLDAEKAVKLERDAGKTYVVNPTPYYFAITSINHNGKALDIAKQERDELGTFKPFSKVDVSELKLPTHGTLTFDALNDWGGDSRLTF
ncbi:fimbrial chaperone [Vibrio vulnificus]|nr:fimbrial chaperone [Vibrio vulnificus]EJN6713460.1 fimbrial chaperone [Vibrio vulnificus]MCU8168123.1 fimbrial chaperone [Vibrio vulnificus]MCU8172709.1 fimbrial chaperone [Vibrio vulnificus]MCU8269271.1 fimbrial chaperone [Vibrio vulnificus]